MVTSAQTPNSTGANPLSEDNAEISTARNYTLAQLSLYALKLGTVGFGGPVALVGYMHRDLVESRKWISEADYKEGLTLAQLMPGPLAAQLAIYLGYVHYGILGATLVGVAFVVPSFLMVCALGWAYVAYGGLPWMQAVFYGIGAAVIGIITLSAYKLTVKSIGKDKLLWIIYLISMIVTVIIESEIVWLFLGAGVLVWLVRTRPKIFRRGATVASFTALPLAALPGIPAASSKTLWQIFLFFTKAGAFVFGSGLAIVPFLYGGVVKEYGWLNDQEFLDAVAVAMLTPGPIVITVAFIGYLVAAFPGALAAAIGVFLPVYLFVVIPFPWFDRISANPKVKGFVAGVTAAASGTIAGACFVLARRAIIDVPTLVIGATALVVAWRFKIPEPVLIAVGAAAGVVIFALR